MVPGNSGTELEVVVVGAWLRDMREVMSAHAPDDLEKVTGLERVRA